MTLLSDHVSIITGGTVGIGRAAAIALAKQGAAVVIVGRTPSRVAAAVSSLKQESTSSVLGVVADVRQAEAMEAMVQQTLEQFGHIDSLIAAAGILRPSSGTISTLQKMSVTEWHEVLDVNLKGTFLSNRAVLSHMIERRSGQIINVSSTSGRKGYALDTAYCASKFGVIGLSEALAQEVRAYGIRVQVLLPGAIATAIWDQNGPIPKPENVLPVDRVAAMILYLLTLPPDAVCAETVIEPFRVHDRPSWLQASRNQRLV